MRDLAIDADSILYNVFFQKSVEAEGDMLEQLKKEFFNRCYDLANRLMVDKLEIVLTDSSNFRYKIDPNYKGNRKPSLPLFTKFKELVRSDDEVRVWANFEADDVVSYFVRHRGYTGASIDKDLLRGCVGGWYDMHHTRGEYRVTKAIDANRFRLQQTLMGDCVDNIKGIPSVGMTRAKKLLERHGYTWEGVEKSYREMGVTVEEAYKTYQLIDVNCITKEYGDKLCTQK